MLDGLKRLGRPPLFRPDEGQTVLAPPGEGPGYWAGAASVLWEPDRNRFLMYYRLRRPRDPEDPNERGYECRIAESSDGIHFRDLWSATKHEFNAVSLERAALVRAEDNLYRLYISMERLETKRWEIWVLQAPAPEAFRPRDAQPFLAPIDARVAHVKDPFVVRIGGLYYFFLNYHPVRWQSSSTALVVSEDGLRPYWVGDVFVGSQGWDATIARLTTVLYRPPMFWAFYDGGETMRESCEERTGLAFSFDLRTFHRWSLNGPVLTSPHGSRSLRYCQAVNDGERTLVYYEYTRIDGSHELRVAEIPRDMP